MKISKGAIQRNLTIVILFISFSLVSLIVFFGPYKAKQVAMDIMRRDAVFIGSLLSENLALGVQAMMLDNGESMDQSLGLLRSSDRKDLTILTVNIYDNKFDFIRGLNNSDSTIISDGKILDANLRDEVRLRLSENNKYYINDLDEKTQLWAVMEDVAKKQIGFIEIVFSKNYLTDKINQSTLIFIVLGSIIFVATLFMGYILQKTVLEVESARTESELKSKELALANNELSASIEKIKEAQSMLVQSEKLSAIGQMVAGVAHEINTPRATIEHYLSILRKKSDKSLAHDNAAEWQKLLMSISQDILPAMELASTRVGEIVEGLLNFARKDHKTMRMANVNQIVQSVIVLLNNQIKNKIDLDIKYGEVPEIACFPGQLNQVFMNILSNSIQAITGHGRMSLETGVSNGNIMVLCQDSGSGMSNETMSKIFDPFFTTKPVGKGTGLGLSISYEIIKKHGGSIQFDSQLGIGTKVTISLPINQNLE